MSPIGADDDFFELGGYSLLVAKLIGAIDREFNAQIPAEQIFSTQPFRRLRPPSIMPVLDAHSTCSSRCVQAGRSRHCSASYPAGGHVFGFVALAVRGDEERPFIAIQCRTSTGRPHHHCRGTRRSLR